MTNAFEIGLDVSEIIDVMPTLKYQLLGDSAFDAKKGNFSLSVEVKAGFEYSGAGRDGYDSGGGDEEYDYFREGFANISLFEYGLLAGCRFADNQLIAIHPYYSIGFMDAHVSTVSANFSSDEKSADSDGVVRTYGVNFNYWYYFGKNLHKAVILGLDFQDLEWAGGPTRFDAGLGAAFSWLLF